MKKIIIFGGSGFIGKHYRSFFKKELPGCMVFSYDLNPDEDSNYIDVRQSINIQEEFEKDDLIINLAAIHTTPGHPEKDYFETNILGAENVCRFAADKQIDNIIFTSSIAPYGASEGNKSELTLPTPNTPYGISKLVAEKIHQIWETAEKERRLLIIRPGVVFGKGENGNFTRLYQALSKKRFFYPGRKDTIKACIYVKDLVQLSFNILSSYDSGTKLYNFTYEPAPDIETIVNAINAETNVGFNPITVSGNFLKLIAIILGSIGFKRMGIHPDRVKKLMTSTNISGKKILQDKYEFKYTINSAIFDWFEDCEKMELK